jgi:hypothetical protein
MLTVQCQIPHLRGLLLQEVRRQLGDAVDWHLSGQDSLRFDHLLRLGQADHRYQVREGLEVGELTPAQENMLAMALQAAGTVVLAHLEGWESYPQGERRHAATLGNRLPCVVWHYGRPMAEAVGEALDLWADHRRFAERTFAYNGSGSQWPGGRRIMVVGERVNPWRPYDQARRLAFTRPGGCSLHLHEALVQHPTARYYLTNAWKTGHAGQNLDLLAAELDRVRPHQIVGMGLVAQSYLADLRVEFSRTFHPQFWRRFRAHDLAGLAAAVKPEFHF